MNVYSRSPGESMRINCKSFFYTPTLSPPSLNHHRPASGCHLITNKHPRSHCSFFSFAFVPFLAPPGNTRFSGHISTQFSFSFTNPIPTLTTTIPIVAQQKNQMKSANRFRIDKSDRVARTGGRSAAATQTTEVADT